MEFINIMSSEGRDYLPKTIKSIPKGNEIQFFFQYSKERFNQDVPYDNIWNNKKLYADVQLNAQWHYAFILENSFQALKTKSELEDYIIIAEDDIQFSKNFNQYFDEIKKDLPERYILSLYCPYPSYISNLAVIEYPVDGFYGTQLMVYDRQTSLELSKHISDNLGKEPYDLAIKSFVKKTNIPLLTTTYSLCEHIGEVSTGLGGGHKAGRFIDEYIK
jgi:hypothetical protein